MSSETEARDKSQICEHLQRELSLLLSLNVEPERWRAAREARSLKRAHGKSDPARREHAEPA